MVPDGTNRRGPVAGIAEEVLSNRGVDFASTVPAKGWTNGTWLAGELVVRVAPTAGPAGLLREAGLATCLPVQVGYPDIIDARVLHGHEWVLTRRLLGENLSALWSGLDWNQRASAIEQVWAKAEYVHRVDVSIAAPYVRPRSPFFPESATEAKARLHRLVSAGLLTARQVVGLGEALDRFWAALPRMSKVLNHGDLGKVNVLWHDGKVVSLVDFEFAVIGPVEILPLHDQLGRNPRATRADSDAPAGLTCFAPRGTVIGYGLGPAKGPACGCCSICCLLAPVS